MASRPKNNPGTSKLTAELLTAILNKLVIRPRLKAAARETGISAPTLFAYISRAQHLDPDPVLAKLSWLGVVRRFDEHVQIARRLSVVAMDASARDQAINGWAEPKFHDGKPVYKRDPVLEAAALDPEWWEAIYAPRPITDTFARDQNGGLIQEEIFHPPNPALLTKLLASLAPDIYADRSEVHHTHTGGVWIENDKPAQLAAPQEATDDLHQTFQMTSKPDPQQRSSNVLAIPARCETSQEFDKKFRKKLVREVTLFRDAKGILQEPLSDDMIVRGSWQDEAFTEAGVPHKTVTNEELIAQGYENDFLRTEVEPPTPKRVLNEIDAAIEAANRLPDNDMKRDLLKRLNAIKNGETKPFPIDANGHGTIPPYLSGLPAHEDDDVPDDGPSAKPPRGYDEPGYPNPPPPKPERGIGAGPDPHNIPGYGRGMKMV